MSPSVPRPSPAFPRLLLVADGFTDVAVSEQAVEAVRAGVRWVQLRDHAAAPEALADAAERLAERLRAARPGVLLSVNTHVELAQALGTGLHVGWRGPAVGEARRLTPDGVLTAAVHTPAEAKAAADAGADAVLFSPVFPTPSKPGRPGAGLDALVACCTAVPGTPVFALGGITPERVGACRAAGAYGVAVLSGILRAPDAAVAAHRYLDAL